MLFPLALVAAIFQFCHYYWFNASAVSIGSMFIYKFRGHLTVGGGGGGGGERVDRMYTVSTSLSENITAGSFLSFLNLIDWMIR